MISEKLCRRCNKTLELSHFSRRKSKKGRSFSSWCKDCTREYVKTDYPKRRSYYQNKHLQNEYGYGVDELKRKVLAQNNLCAICAQELKFPQQDHNHRTGELRGILCPNCNRGLGIFKEDIHRLQAAIKYLLMYEVTP